MPAPYLERISCTFSATGPRHRSALEPVTIVQDGDRRFVGDGECDGVRCSVLTNTFFSVDTVQLHVTLALGTGGDF